MNMILLGAAGFIGTNLTLALAKQPENQITVVSRRRASFADVDASRTSLPCWSGRTWCFTC